MTLLTTELNRNQFQEISRIVYRQCGISLKSGKEALVRARLMKRLRALQIPSIKEYLELIGSEQGRTEIGTLIDVMTTNKTDFFRESSHFDYLAETILPRLDTRRLRFWSAACSSGEEPYTLAMVLRENIPGIDQKDILILSTDISTQMLETARKGVYTKARMAGVPRAYVQKYFDRCDLGTEKAFRVSPVLRKLIRLAPLNLMEPWPMKGRFDVIFCRNVMIYFDRPTQQRLVKRFHDLLTPGGFLFVGHSEGLSGIRHEFQYMQPATYRKR
ncbi:MAG: protein-glutamate O-methyltransferase [Desulfobacterales bacterium]|jgi:chemotaxis protein methyltransferase CheR